nr:M14 metal carboxypeptidase 15 [Antheraea yamamai]
MKVHLNADMLRLFWLSVLLSYVAARHEFYDGYSLYEIKVKHVDETKFINNLAHEWGLDLWSHAVPGRPGLVMVSKGKRESFQNILNSEGIEFKIQSENVKELLDLEDKLLEDASRKSFNASKMTGLPFDRIYTYHQVDAYLEMLAEAYPRTVTLVNAGKSFEGRDIKYLKISTTNFQDTSKPIVFLESLLHAREWITLPASLYAIHKLVIEVTEGDLLEDIDWIILPIANPDGYVHSHLENRFWRKNRANGYMVGDICVGVDLNRNFDVNWSTASSNTVCMETFHGSGPFSEPETAIIRDIFLQYSDRMELFVDIHSFGSMILYGYGTGLLPPNGLFLHLVGVQMAQAIDAVKTGWNSEYIVGNVALVLYEASGSAGDYGKFAGVPFSYTFELPGFRFGLGALGFLVDPSFIEQAGFETWEGIKVGARYVRNNFRAKHKAGLSF